MSLPRLLHSIIYPAVLGAQVFSTIVETAVTGVIINAQESLGTPNRFLQTYLDTAPTLTITPDSLDPVVLFAGKAPPALQRMLLSPSINATTGHRSSIEEQSLSTCLHQHTLRCQLCRILD